MLKRDDSIDIIKGIGIILMVCGVYFDFVKHLDSKTQTSHIKLELTIPKINIRTYL